ncbi:hypothetical protein [Candidatus Avelusimicrobium alvi]|uniref:hypothetical protein n=1 Tax=Candidatus Avelusimicrobium alvi TaxID=3416221 RepID=UPI003D0C8533
MNTGDVFLALLSANEPKKHFWVVVLAITKSGNAIVGDITSRCKDPSLPINDAEYECLTQPVSYFNFPEMQILPLNYLEDKLKKREMIAKPSVSESLLKQIQQGAIDSQFTPQNIKNLLRQYLKH